jgi:5-methylcytosine-specific restriction endonuclease McrA
MDNRKKAYVIQILRRASYKWKPRYQVLVKSRVGRGQYKCNICSSIVGRKDIQMDHVNPVIPTTGWPGWEEYIDRLLADKESDWQAICRTCHDIKTKEENGERSANKKKSKKKTT